ncbi:unnamed protein product [Auanema sp. JU1783]|nr:unnamed protein product [Auanema sp. JU1783]
MSGKITMQFTNNEITKYIFLFSISTAVFVSTISGDFVYDDRAAISENDDVAGRSSLFSVFFHDFWGNDISSPGSHKSWRPLTTISFRITHSIFGFNSAIFHFVNVLLHGIASCLVYQLGCSRKRIDTVPFLAALLFAVHPIHSEAVASIVGRADVLLTIFVLKSLIDFEKRQNVLHSFFWSALAVGSKESGAILPFLHIVQLFLQNKPRTKLTKVFQLLAIGLGITYFRLFVNNFQKPQFAKSSNPLAFEKNSFTRLLTLLYLPLFNLRLLCFPNTLSFDWSLEYIQPIVSSSDFRIALIIVFYTLVTLLCGLIGLRCFEKISRSKLLHLTSLQNGDNLEDILFFSFILLVSFLPASNLFVYVGFVIAERILYLPSVAFCYLAAVTFVFLEKKFPKYRDILNVAFIAALLLLAQRTISRNADWQTAEGLYRSGMNTSPAKALTNLGRELSDNPLRREEALRAYEAALKIQPNMADAWYNLGVLYNEKKNMSKAERCYREAIRFREYFTQAYLNLGILLWQQQKLEDSLQILHRCTLIDGLRTKSQRLHEKTQISCWLQMAQIYQSVARVDEAKAIIEQIPVVKITNSEQLINAYNLFAEVYVKLDESQKADEFFMKALALSPQNEKTYLNLAYFRVKQNRSEDAVSILDELDKLNFASNQILYHKAVMHTKLGNWKLAEQLLKRNLDMNPNHLNTLNALAFIYKDHKRMLEAEKLLRRVVELEPMSSTSYSNYGAILHIMGKLEDAEVYYLKAIQMGPNDEVASSNLQKLRRSMKLRTKA